MLSAAIRSAYKNLDLKNLPGEKWKDIPGYEDLYQVSNYGRIKSLSRPIQVFITKYNRSIDYETKTRIRKIKVHKRFNAIIQQSYFECTIALKRAGEEKTFLVHRLVYHAFVRPLNFEQDQMMIMHRNGDGLVNHYTNPVAGKRSQVLKRSYALSRHVSPFAVKTKKELKRIQQKAGRMREKPVVQFSLRGKRLKKFASIKLAAKATSVPDSNIVEVLKKRRKMAGGFWWKYLDQIVKNNK